MYLAPAIALIVVPSAGRVVKLARATTSARAALSTVVSTVVKVGGTWTVIVAGAIALAIAWLR